MQAAESLHWELLMCQLDEHIHFIPAQNLAGCREPKLVSENAHIA
jgi:hypothetical protein